MMNKNASYLKGYLTGYFLLAMPDMGDPRFARAVIYIFAHDDEGAMGFIINYRAEDVTLGDVSAQLPSNVRASGLAKLPIYIGGPVQSDHGFVLHTSDHKVMSTLVNPTSKLAMTQTLDILTMIARGKGPAQIKLFIGYAGWSAGQLDAELRQNVWLIAPADEALIFSNRNDDIYNMIAQKLGINVAQLSGGGTA